LAVFLFSLFLFVFITPLRSPLIVPGGCFELSTLVGFVALTYLTMFCLNRYGNNLNTALIITALFLGHIILELPSRILHFESSLFSFPDMAVPLLGIICGALYWRMRTPQNFAALILCVIPVFMYFQGWDYWLQKINYGTFTGSVSYEQPAAFEAYGKDGVPIADGDLENKIVLLDFWHTACGVCFEKFPRLQALRNKYRDDPKVLIFAVNKPIEDDKPGQAFRMIEERGYTFPVAIPKDEELPEKFGVRSYPATFIMVNKKIVFYGDIWLAEGKIEQLRSSLR
jgi:thiol-disulfide isomerase/thioredoxin